MICTLTIASNNSAMSAFERDDQCQSTYAAHAHEETCAGDTRLVPRTSLDAFNTAGVQWSCTTGPYRPPIERGGDFAMRLQGADRPRLRPCWCTSACSRRWSHTANMRRTGATDRASFITSVRF